MNILLGSLTLIIAFASYGQAYAQTSLDRDLTFLMQGRLNELGYNAGEQDGKMGPQTRSALSEYDKRHSSGTEIHEIYGHMVGRSIRARTPADESFSKEQLSEIKGNIANTLFDPSSAIFHDDIYLLEDDANTILCGKLNGKNRFGAYVGWTHFFVLAGSSTYITLSMSNNPVIDSDHAMAEFKCSTSGFDE